MLGFGILDAIKIGTGAIVGAVLCFLVYGPIAEHNGRQQGAVAERAAWQQKMAEQTRKNEADRRAAQDKINAIEKQYLDLNSDTATMTSRMSDLEQELAKERADNDAQAGNPSGACPPAFSRGVSRALNGIGAATGPHPAKPAR